MASSIIAADELLASSSTELSNLHSIETDTALPPLVQKIIMQGNRTARILGGTKLVLVTIQKAAIPIPGIGPIVEGLIALIDKIEKTRSNREGFNSLSEEVEQLVNVINRAISQVRSNIELIPSDDPRRQTFVEGIQRSPRLRIHVESLFNQLVDVQRKADELCQESWWLSCVRSSDNEVLLEELQADIVKCRMHFQTECGAAILNSVEEILRKLSQSEDEKILESLPHAEASYRAEAITMSSYFLPGTRKELFHAIDDWVQGSQELSGKAVCILTGDAGTGKSTIACEFARIRDEEKKDYGASFFFVRGEADLDSTKLVFPTLAYQLAQSQDALYPHIVKAAREHLKRGRTQQMKYQATSLIHGPVHEVNDGHRPIVLVLDGLDVCSESEKMRILVPEMLKLLLASVHRARFPLRIFLTSRPDSLLEKTLLQPQWASLVHQISLNDASHLQESVRKDMETFVHAKLEQFPSGQAKTLLQQPEVVERLAQRARGQFVYAQTAIDFLSDYPSFVEGSRLDNLLSGGSSTCATKLQPLDDLYLTVLETAWPSGKDQSLPQALRPILDNLVVLRNSMSLVVLEALTGIPRGDLCKVLNPLRAVVVLNEARPEEKVRVKHTTFSEFLTNKKRCMNMKYYEAACFQHSRLVGQCLGALQSLDMNMCQLPDPTMPRADIPDLAERLEMYVPEHVQYACVHWAAHLKEACSVKKRTDNPGSACYCWKIGKTLEEFTGSGTPTKLQAWVEVMAYMGRLDTVMEALDIAQVYLKDKYPEVTSVLAATKQLVDKDYSEIEQCPYKVYQFTSSP